MQKAWLLVSLSVISLAACKESAHQYRLAALEQSVFQSNQYLKARVPRALRRIDDKWYNPRYRQRAEKWRMKAARVQKTSEDAIAYLDSLKYALTQQHQNPSKLFDVKAGGSSVYYRLLKYKTDMLSVVDTIEFKDVSPEFLEQLKKDACLWDIHMELLLRDTAVKTTSQQAAAIKKWTDNHFGASSTAIALTMLGKLQNDVWVSQIQLTDYLSAQIPSSWCGYYINQGKALISSAAVKEGQVMTIYAGAGHFDFDNHPRYFVQDSVILADYDGWAKHRFKVQGAPGKHLLPVQFEYEEGEVIKTDTQQLQYIIVP
jgi:hypothetical protein